MNDEFLHALRRDPPPEFARELQRRLQRQSCTTKQRALDRAYDARGGADRRRRDGRGAAAPGSTTNRPAKMRRSHRRLHRGAARVRTQPAVTPRPTGKSLASPASQPQAAEPEAKDIPLALVTSSLARPLAQALVEHVSKSGKFAQPRVMTMDDDEAFRALCGNVDFVIVSRRISDGELRSVPQMGHRHRGMEARLPGRRAHRRSGGRAGGADAARSVPRARAAHPRSGRTLAADRQSQRDLARRRCPLRLPQHRRPHAARRHDPCGIRCSW